MSGTYPAIVDRWKGTTRVALTADERTLTYAMWAAEGERLAHGLVAAGLERPARVVALLPNGPEFAIALYACARVGLTLVPISTWATEHEVARILDAAEPDLLLATRSFPGLVDKLIAASTDGHGPGPKSLWCWGPSPRGQDIADLVAAGDALAGPLWETAARGAEPGADLVVLYTSGSTGDAKGVILQQGAVVRNGAAIAERMGLSDRERVYSYFPMFFSGGLCNALTGAASVGAELVTQARYDPAAAATLIRSRHCTARNVWHDGFEPIVAVGALDRSDLLRMRRGLSVDASTMRKMGLVDDEAVNMYGMTETATAFTCGDWREPYADRAASHGRPLPGNKVRISDPTTGSPVGLGSEGEICVCGPNLMRGYTDASHVALFDDDGFFHTGDVGWLGGDGLLHYVGRTRTLIKVRGLSVQPEEVESVLFGHDAVSRVVVVGIGEGDESSAVAALVALKPEATVSEEDLVEHCRARLSSYKVPIVRRVTNAEFPLNASFKVDRLAAQRLFASR